MKPPDQESPGGPIDPAGTDGTAPVDSNASKRVSKRSDAHLVGGRAFSVYRERGPGLSNAANRPAGFTPLPASRIALIHVAKQQTGISEESYKELLWLAEGVINSKELTDRGFNAVMDAFRRIGFVGKGKPPHYGARDGMATPAQVQAIWAMWREWSSDGGQRSLDLWLKSRFGFSSLRFLTTSGAQMAIEGLKAMLARKAANTTNGA